MPYKVLFIDDQNNPLQVLLDDLNHRAQHNNERIEFVGLSEPDDVLTRITEDQPDAIFLDIHFGNQKPQGLEILKNIKDHYPYMPVVMMTGEERRPGVNADERSYWQADALLYKDDFMSGGNKCSAGGWGPLMRTCLSTIGYHGIPLDPVADDPRLHANCVGHLQGVQHETGPKALFFLQGESGSSRRLFALAIQKELDLEDACALTEINCACLNDNGRPDFLELFASSRGRVLFLRDVDQIPEESEADFIAAIEEWREDESNWVVVATSGPTNTLFGQGIETVFGQNIRAVNFPSLNDRFHADRRRRGNERSFETLCNSIIQRRCEFTQQNIIELTPDALLLLALHEWSGGIRELEEVLNVAVDNAKEGAIGTNHIRYERYEDPSVCEYAARIVSEPEREKRINLINKRIIKKDKEFIRELLIRDYVRRIHENQDSGNMEKNIDSLGLNYGTIRHLSVINEIKSKITQAKKELETPASAPD